MKFLPPIKMTNPQYLLVEDSLRGYGCDISLEGVRIPDDGYSLDAIFKEVSQIATKNTREMASQGFVLDKIVALKKKLAEPPTEEPMPTTKPKKAPAAKTVVPVDNDLAEEIDDGRPHFSIDLIDPSPFNRRRIPLDDASIGELAQSIKSVGLLNPISIRPTGKRFEIVAGHRRFLAYKALGRKKIPAYVLVDNTDAETREAQIVENIQRQDLGPFEEAHAIDDLANLGAAWTYERIGVQLGKSARYVAERRRLIQLIDRFVDAYHRPTSPASAWPIATLIEIAKLPEATQKNLWENLASDGEEIDDHETSPADVMGVISNMERMLAHAYWELDDAELVPAVGPCVTCPKRSSAEPFLFQIDEPANDRCLDADCFAAKQTALVDRQIAAAKEKHGKDVVLINDAGVGGVRSEGLVYDWNVQPCKPSDPGARPAVIVNGPRSGETKYVKAPNGSGPISAPKQKSLKERRQELQRKRIIHAMKEIAECLDDIEGDVVSDHAKPTALDIVRLAVVYGTKEKYGQWAGVEEAFKTRWAKVADKSRLEIYPRLWESVRPVIQTRLKWKGVIDDPVVDRLWLEAETIGAVVGLNTETFLATATAANPEPKAWSAVGKKAKAK